MPDQQAVIIVALWHSSKQGSLVCKASARGERHASSDEISQFVALVETASGLTGGSHDELSCIRKYFIYS